MFRIVPLSIIRSLFIVHSAMVYVIQICIQLSSRSICSCSRAEYKPVWRIPLLSVRWINPWWWAEELSETCRISCQSKFVKSVHLVGFIIQRVHILLLVCVIKNFRIKLFILDWAAFFYLRSWSFSSTLVYRTARYLLILSHVVFGPSLFRISAGPVIMLIEFLVLFLSTFTWIPE